MGSGRDGVLNTGPSGTLQLQPENSINVRNDCLLCWDKILRFITAYGPLEQFATIPSIPVQSVSFIYQSLSVHATHYRFNFTLSSFVGGRGHLVPNARQSLVEMIHESVPNPVNEWISGASKQQFLPPTHKVHFYLFHYFGICKA